MRLLTLALMLTACGPDAETRAMCRYSAQTIRATTSNGVTYWRGGRKFECVEGGGLERRR